MRCLMFLCVFMLMTVSVAAQNPPEAAAQPNIVLIYTDDFGYADVGCYGARGVKTPNIDSLATGGLKFTDAHSPSATCTPSRYAMLTGQYAWRQKGTGIAKGDAAAIIKPGRTTMASLLRQAGYRTGVVGKWHLGLGDGQLDWNQAIKPGPLEIGFDHCFLIPATGDRVPCVYVEDHHVVDLDPSDPIRVQFGKALDDQPSGKTDRETLKMDWSHGHNMTIVNGISRIGWMSGGESARWVDEDMADRITEKAVQFIENQKGSGQPFFLYFSTHDIHVPRVPHARFVGKSTMGPRGDTIAETDWCVGQLLDALQACGMTENTMVIFTSDNGPVLDDGYQDSAVESLGSHDPAGPFRGGKYSNFEAGTRVPMIVKWPGVIQPGTVSDALMCQVDFPATFASLGKNQSMIKIPKGAIPDSQVMASALLGQSKQGREYLVEHGGALALRHGSWKYIEPSKKLKYNPRTDIELGNHPEGLLYNLADDPGETTNLANAKPARVKAMQAKLASLRKVGQTSPKSNQ
ncbi:MAG: arylsulfatase [Mariniblastus sp.]|nr:arylsulfatase [Mariniblastus sp.]